MQHHPKRGGKAVPHERRRWKQLHPHGNTNARLRILYINEKEAGPFPEAIAGVNIQRVRMNLNDLKLARPCLTLLVTEAGS